MTPFRDIDEEAFEKAFEDFHDFVKECRKKYHYSRPPENSSDFLTYKILKKNLAKFYVHCDNTSFLDALYIHDKEFAELFESL